MIALRGLSKKYGEQIALDGIDLDFAKGGVYGIVGENGAGKTTLFRCIAGLERFKGTVSSEVEPLKEVLGLLPTEPFFFSKMTGREYIQLMCNARNKKVGNLSERNLFDLPLDRYAATYSTGMKKKLALTAVLLQENEIFILDEPFNGVDIQSNIVIEEVIRHLKSLGKTVLISSHIFSTLSATCDRISLMRAGQIVKSVQKQDFEALEAEMKAATIGNKVERMGLA